jgi:hypothetical protein
VPQHQVFGLGVDVSSLPGPGDERESDLGVAVPPLDVAEARASNDFARWDIDDRKGQDELGGGILVGLLQEGFKIVRVWDEGERYFPELPVFNDRSDSREM